MMEQLKALGACVYIPGKGQVVYSKDQASAFWESLDKEYWNLDATQTVNKVTAEYDYILSQPCECGGIYSAFPLTRGQVCFQHGDLTFDALITQCLLCGKEKTFLCDITSFYGQPPGPEWEQEMKRSIFKQFALISARAGDEIASTLSEEMLRIGTGFMVRRVLEEKEAQFHTPAKGMEVYSKPLNLHDLRHLVEIKFGKATNPQHQPYMGIPSKDKASIDTHVAKLSHIIDMGSSISSLTEQITKVKQERRRLEALLHREALRPSLLLPDNSTISIELHKPELWVGREHFRGALPEDKRWYISREHFLITWENGVYYIEHRHATNPTRLNGVDIKGRGKQKLKDGDKINIAEVVEITVSLPGQLVFNEREEIRLSLRIINGLILFSRIWERMKKDKPTPETRDAFLFVEVKPETKGELESGGVPHMQLDDSRVVMTVRKEPLMLGKTTMKDIVATITSYVECGEWPDETIIGTLVMTDLLAQAANIPRSILDGSM